MKNTITYKHRQDIDALIKKHVETLYIEITAKSRKKIILGSLYRAQNTPPNPFNNHITQTVELLQGTKRTCNPKIILGMDHNYDLLKCHLHKQTQQFLDIILYNDLLPTITRPTRITQTTANLIDNIFVTKTLHHNFDSLILLNDMSDHLPTLTLLKQTKIVDKDPIIFESCCLNDVKLGKIKQELSNIDWNGHSNSEDCNVNFIIFCDILSNTMDKYVPIMKVRISSKCRFCEPWMTTGIEEASQKTKTWCFQSKLR